jgi:hypothetical protein
MNDVVMSCLLAVNRATAHRECSCIHQRRPVSQHETKSLQSKKEFHSPHLATMANLEPTREELGLEANQSNTVIRVQGIT